MAKIIISQQGVGVREIELDKPRLTIGRAAQNDVVLAHRAVSGKHAVIASRDGELVLEDLDSTNGTLVNGRPVKQHVLQDRDIINLPDTQIEYIAEQQFEQSVTELVADRPDDGAPPVPAGGAGPHAALVKVLSGINAGKQLMLTKPLTTLGKPGVQVAVIQRGDSDYYLAHVEGQHFPVVNGAVIGAGPHLLHDGDLLELSGTAMAFMFR